VVQEIGAPTDALKSSVNYMYDMVKLRSIQSTIARWYVIIKLVCFLAFSSGVAGNVKCVCCYIFGKWKFSKSEL